MAEKIIKVDDLDGKEYDPTDGMAGTTVTFMYDRVAYEIDLRSENVEKFRATMAPYVASARRAGNSGAASASRSQAGSASRRRGGGQGMGRSKEELDTIRRWARANGHTVADSGLIPRAIVEAWEKRDQQQVIPSTPAAKPAAAPEKASDAKSPVAAVPDPKPGPGPAAVKPPVAKATPAFSGVRGSDNR